MIKQFLSWNKKQRIVIVLLMILLIGIVVFNQFLNSRIPDLKLYSEVILNNATNTLIINSNTNQGHISSPREQLENFKNQKFNPNQLKKEGWMALGLSEKIALRVEKYLQHNGHFYKNEDVKKIYDFPENVYQKILPLMIFEQKKIISKQKINLNLDSQETFEKLKGIGPKIAQRIVKYKNLLGGFYDKKQLKEVWGIDEQLYIQIENDVIVSANDIHTQKLNVNTAAFKDLNRHPYIGFDLAKIIVSLRQKLPFQNLEDMKLKTKANDTTIQKLSNYICF